MAFIVCFALQDGICPSGCIMPRILIRKADTIVTVSYRLIETYKLIF